jgi:hypothetical protein
MRTHCHQSLQALFFVELVDKEIPSQKVETLSISHLGVLQGKRLKHALKGLPVFRICEKLMGREGSADVLTDLNENRVLSFLRGLNRHTVHFQTLVPNDTVVERG